MEETTRQTVLIVEDDASCREALTACLKKHGFDVLTAEDGLEAVELIEETEKAEHKIDLVLADLLMPRMDGFDFVKFMKMSHPEIIVGAVSAKKMCNEILNSGASFFFQKPLNVAGLVATMRSFLSPAKCIT